MMPGIQKAFAVSLYPKGLAMALGKLMVGLSDLEPKWFHDSKRLAQAWWGLSHSLRLQVRKTEKCSHPQSKQVGRGGKDCPW